jgi:putative serine protease PepD
MGMPGGPGMYGPDAPTGPGTYRPPSRAGRRLAAAAAVLALAVGSGVLGGWIALQADDSTSTTTVAGATNTSNNSRPAPVINRDDLANVAAAVQPSVVSIKTDDGEGSGVVYDDQGNIVTNNHVVASANGDTVTVIFNDGKSVEGRIVNTDARTDLAVVKVSNVSGLTPAKIGDSGSMRVGDTVIALGSPLGLEGTVTAGIISALDRTIQVGNEEQQNPFQQQQQSATQTISGLLQTDAPINPGNSGGALANTKGEVIGINNAIAGSSSGGNIGVGFAIPSNKVKNVADQLIKGGKVTHPFLGVSVGEATNGGALVSGVTPNSPAAKAGIQEGDVITKLGGKAIADADDLISAVQSGNVGDRLELTYTRNGDQKTATVTLADAS